MCAKPELPIFDGSAVPSSRPVRCTNCGAELYLACGPDSPAPEGSPLKGKPRVKYVLKPKPCARCLRTFQPSGPRSLYCGRADCDDYARFKHSLDVP